MVLREEKPSQNVVTEPCGASIVDESDGSSCFSNADEEHCPPSRESESLSNHEISRIYEPCKSLCISDCSGELELECNALEIKVDVELEKDCRICLLSLESLAWESGSPIVLGCSCKDDLAAAHKQCAEAWFKIKGNKTCEICGVTAKNVVGVGEPQFMERWNGTTNDLTPTGLRAETQSFWQSHRFLNFLLACMIELTGEKIMVEPHVLVFPFPLQGHVTTMLRLADAISNAGLRLTFLNTDYNHALLDRFSASHHRLSRRPRFRFISIPDGLPEDNPRTMRNFVELEESLRTRSLEFYKKVLRDDGDGWPPVSCVLVDGLMPFAMDAAQELGIPAIVFRTISGACIWAYLCIPRLVEAAEFPFPEKADWDDPINCVPGMEGYLRRRDLPGFFRHTSAAGEKLIRIVGDVTADSLRARGGIILNTSEHLEGPILSHIRSLFPLTYAVGPLHALSASVTSFSASGSLWAEDRSAILWLDAQPDRSVVYVSFGSIAELSTAQFLEFWHGFVDSGHRFLWVLRPGLVAGWERAPPEVDRVKMVSWVPQEEVLRHRAVGCFLTHCGWNSTLESLVAGIPMVCWPLLADQQINSRLVGEVWRVGIDMKDIYSREAVERAVKAAMEGETAEALRRAAAEMAVEVGRSVEDGGCARLEFEKLIRDISALGSSGD
ncbi:hypothetical protein HPP92_026964 [Vanilla planifolia]|uniref:RING-CH-type domain-containing protein n=2 Tax=Vanilla planifolia TaxID=51239 RepID=A0A835PAU4_VANPL|nr:hypothetical protein HPP92_026964 [Vanilla planifolia]